MTIREAMKILTPLANGEKISSPTSLNPKLSISELEALNTLLTSLAFYSGEVPPRPDLVLYLRGIFNETESAGYMGGSLTWGSDEGCYCLNVSGKGFFTKDGAEFQIEQTAKERYWVCKLYLLHKTPNHAFHKEASDYVLLCEAGNRYG